VLVPQFGCHLREQARRIRVGVDDGQDSHGFLTRIRLLEG
jgi:hypothetical protein